MKKLGAALVGIIVVTIIGYGLWVQTPKVSHPEQVALIVSSAQARWDEKQSQANDPAQNGYLEPTFLPYWKYTEVEDKNLLPVFKTVQDWAFYSSFHGSRPIDHKTLRNDPEYRKALSAFEKLEPTILDAFSKQSFLLPDSKGPNLTKPGPSYVRLVELSQAALGLAEARIIQGRPESAARLIGSVARLGGSLSNQTFLLQESSGTSISQLACDAYVGLLSPNDLDREEWREISLDFDSAVSPKDQVALTMESELNSVLRLLSSESALSETVEISAVSLVLKAPGFVSRESRIISNMMVDIIAMLKKTPTATYPETLAHPVLTDFIVGRTGLACTFLIGNYPKLGFATEQQRKRVASLALVSGIRAFLAQEKRLPKSLDELEAAGISLPSVQALDGVTLDFRPARVTITANYPSVAGQTARQSTFPTPAWAEESVLGTLSYEVALP